MTAETAAGLYGLAAAPAGRASLTRWWARLSPGLPFASAVLAAAWWAGPVARDWGGRGGGPVAVGAVLVALAVLLTRPDRVWPGWVLALPMATSLAAFAVPIVAPTGWAGVTRAAAYVCSGWLGLVVATAVARRPRGATVVALVLVSATAVEFAESWLPWWGGENPARPMVGTFYWHNPFAMFLVPGALLGAWLWVRSSRLAAVLGLLALVLGTTGVVYSTSRAGLACLGAGVAVLAVAVLLPAGRRRHLVRLVLGLGTTAATVFLVAGPPFFPSRVGPGAALAARTAGQSLGQNGGYRLDFWQEAWGVFSRHPLAGGGYHSMAAASVGHVPAGWPLSPFAHNGFLQVLSDGGLLLGVPFLLTVGLVGFVAVRRLLRALVRREPTLTGFAVPLVVLALLAHSAVDFDWSYPANLAIFAVTAGLMLGTSPRPSLPPSRRAYALPVVVAAVGLLGLTAWTARPGDFRLNLPVAHDAPAAQVKHVANRADNDPGRVTTSARLASAPLAAGVPTFEVPRISP